MISQIIPLQYQVSKAGGALKAPVDALCVPAGMRVMLRGTAGAYRADGAFRIDLCDAARLQGAHVHSRVVPGADRARRAGACLLPSRARPAGPAGRWRALDGGDRQSDRALSALFGGPRGAGRGALWIDRDIASRSGGPGCAERGTEDARADQGRGRAGRPRRRISNLGAEPLPGASRGGHCEGACPEAADRFPGATRDNRAEGA